jgi:nucleoid-associated protein YgaU
MATKKTKPKPELKKEIEEQPEEVSTVNFEKLAGQVRNLDIKLSQHLRQRHPAGPAKPAPSKKQRTYVVQAGDSLSQIAKALLGNAGRFREISAINKIKNPDSIFEGQELIIPAD